MVGICARLPTQIPNVTLANTRRSVLAGVGAALFDGSAAAQDGPPRVLFIGNSLTYSNNLPGVVEAVFRLAGLSLVTQMEAQPNFSLGDHWDNHAAQRLIRRGGWSTVVLQQGPSAREDSRVQLRRDTQRFAELIAEVGATPALFSVWPSRSRLQDFQRAEESYALAAADVSGVLLPVAAAWREAFRLAPEIDLYSDGLHPTREGSLLAALVMFGALTSRSPMILSASAETTPLQQAAANALSAAAATH
jgi:hypothetical protein